MNIGEQDLFIGGQWTPSESGETYEALDPFTGGTATRAASATVADVDRAVGAAAFGSFANSGQGCLSTERIIVDKSIAAEFCRRLAAVAKTIVHGDPRNSATVLEHYATPDRYRSFS